MDLAVGINSADLDPRPEPFGSGHDRRALHNLGPVPGVREQRPAQSSVVLIVEVGPQGNTPRGQRVAHPSTG